MFVLLEGCVDDVPPPDAPLGEVVKTFASEHGNYFLMSAEYRNSVSEGSFLGKMIQCKPSFKHYEFVGVINGSERMEGDFASVEIQYLEKPDEPVFGKDAPQKEVQEMGNRTIYLTKERGGWRLRELYCELVGK